MVAEELPLLLVDVAVEEFECPGFEELLLVEDGVPVAVLVGVPVLVLVGVPVSVGLGDVEGLVDGLVEGLVGCVVGDVGGAVLQSCFTLTEYTVSPAPKPFQAMT